MQIITNQVYVGLYAYFIALAHDITWTHLYHLVIHVNLGIRRIYVRTAAHWSTVSESHVEHIQEISNLFY